MEAGQYNRQSEHRADTLLCSLSRSILRSLLLTFLETNVILSIFLRETYSSPQAGKNPFLSLAILYTIRLISELKGSTHLSSKLAAKSLKVTIVGDNDFYSQRVQSSSQEVSLGYSEKISSMLNPHNQTS